ncbi:hypothetical protein [Sphingobium yanoikuyae]|uniref:hypothetical protein n=1 Tax=Sphingobium yanoikuyae TaxID=13690 RepID=UPI0028AB1C1E|nr:hypothetical protein [Sphingobium yanoikuyae]
MAKKPGLGERLCPKCKEVIKADASICKHCRTEFTAEELAAAKKQQDQSNLAAGIGCLGIVLLLSYCVYTSGDKASVASAPEKPAATAKADAAQFYRNILTAIGPCDAAGKGVAAAGKAGDAIALYQAANSMEQTCLGTSSAIRAIEVPSSVGKAAFAKLTETREVCENTYSARWASAGKMKEALDGGGVARLAELKDITDAVQAGTLSCVAGLVGQAMELGATEKDLGMDTGTQK